MVAAGGSIRPNSISSRDAIRELYQHVKACVAGPDPAPWCEVSEDAIALFADGDRAGYVRTMKLHERTKLIMQSALLSGELRAHYYDGRGSLDIPGWAWIGAERNEAVWFEGRLPLDVFLPDDWQRWSCQAVFMDNNTFRTWIARQDFSKLGGLPDLPRPYDSSSHPLKVRKRLPPDNPFVTLSEALSWIAFSFSMDSERLDQAVHAHAIDGVDMEQALAAAVSQLATKAAGSLIELRGKYVQSRAVNEAAVRTQRIEAERFEDFAQFDIHYDGLAYGTGLTWVQPGSVLNRVLNDGQRDSFRSVKVCRAELLTHFPDNQPELAASGRVPFGDPLAVTIGELTLPGDDFDPLADAPVSPWWSVLQAIGWIATGSKAYVDYIAGLEGAASDDIGTSVAFSAVVTYVARKHCRCAAHVRPDDARWEYCTCTGDAGRGLLEAIRTDRAKAIQRTPQGPKQLAFHDLAGVGQRPTCVDWLNNNLTLQFSSAEVIGAFPANPRGQSEDEPKAQKRPGPAPDPDWPHAIAKVTQDCIAAGYKRARKRGDKAAIQTMLLGFMAEKDKHPSEDTAAKYAEQVIAALPDD